METISKVRFGFMQDIYRLPDDRPLLKSKVIGTVQKESGRPHIPEEIEKLLKEGIQSADS